MTTPVICVRCGAVGHPDVEHVCADIARRLARREKQAAAVRELLLDAYGDANGALAEKIVATLARMGVTED